MQDEKKILSVTLKDEFNARQCFDASARIRGMKGVERAHHLPEGCFGVNSHKLFVAHDGAGEELAKEIAKMPEVKSVRAGYNF
jgi:hypothetical protein